MINNQKNNKNKCLYIKCLLCSKTVNCSKDEHGSRQRWGCGGYSTTVPGQRGLGGCCHTAGPREPSVAGVTGDGTGAGDQSRKAAEQLEGKSEWRELQLYEGAQPCFLCNLTLQNSKTGRPLKRPQPDLLCPPPPAPCDPPLLYFFFIGPFGSRHRQPGDMSG